MKLLLDMNLAPRWVDALARAGIEAAHWSSVGPPNASDHEILAHAAAEGWVIVTHDLDFGAALAIEQRAAPSVIQFRSGDLSPERLLNPLLAALRLLSDELRDGALVTINPARTRVGMLPLPRRS